MTAARDEASGATLQDRKRAIGAFETSERTRRVFAPVLRDGFACVNKQELQVFSRQISPVEHETRLGTV